MVFKMYVICVERLLSPLFGSLISFGIKFFCIQWDVWVPGKLVQKFLLVYKVVAYKFQEMIVLPRKNFYPRNFVSQNIFQIFVESKLLLGFRPTIWVILIKSHIFHFQKLRFPVGNSHTPTAKKTPWLCCWGCGCCWALTIQSQQLQ